MDIYGLTENNISYKIIDGIVYLDIECFDDLSSLDKLGYNIECSLCYKPSKEHLNYVTLEDWTKYDKDKHIFDINFHLKYFENTGIIKASEIYKKHIKIISDFDSANPNFAQIRHSLHICEKISQFYYSEIRDEDMISEECSVGELEYELQRDNMTSYYTNCGIGSHFKYLFRIILLNENK